MKWRAPAAAATLGAVLTTVVAWRLDMPTRDLASLLLLAAGGAAVAAVAGAVALASMRSASIRTQAVVVALIAVLGIVVGVGLAANAMFVSSHDLGALAVVLLGSATVAITVALVFGVRIGTASADLVELARRLGDGDLLLVDDRPVAVELQRLASELESASARLDESRRRQHEIEKARRQLVAGVSHDLRTPLASIRAMVEALADGVVSDPADVARYHSTMNGEVIRLTALVDDLFELSRIEAGALDLRLERVRLGDIVGEAVAGAAPLAAARGVVLAGGPVDPDPVIEVAPAELVRVVRNLLDNGIRHTPDGGCVEVRCGVDDDGGRARISVRDECGGISSTDLPHVFDLAYRGDSARGRSEGEGSGLGLAIARGLVNAHHGTISVVNEGPGCRFTVELATIA